MRGMGRPRGPEFRTLPLSAQEPVLNGMPQTVPNGAPNKARLLVTAALIAALTGAAAGVAGARLFEEIGRAHV